MRKIADLNRYHLLPEKDVVEMLKENYPLTVQERGDVSQKAALLIQAHLQTATKRTLVNRLMNLYPLSSKEGLALMSLCEALLRIPDAKTANLFIEDQLSLANFDKDFSQGGLLERVSSSAMRVASRFFGGADAGAVGGVKKAVRHTLNSVTAKSAELLVKQLAGQFVIAEGIDKAMTAARKNQKIGFCHSFDMLGEAAETEQDAQRYFNAYLEAIERVGGAEKEIKALKSSISVKLSALHPKYVSLNQKKALVEISERLLELAKLAKEKEVSLTVDAEEVDRLELSLLIFERVRLDPSLKGWDGFGLAVQAYQKRTLDVIRFVKDLGERAGCRILMRLVKGAYWDTEIKRAQVLGLEEYPVFTRKCSTDISYLVCANEMLKHSDVIGSAFATHNVHTYAAIKKLAEKRGLTLKDFEFQCLFGMGSELYQDLLRDEKDLKVRLYAPVGNHRDLLPYLVRRLLENGANSSFVNVLHQSEFDLQKIVQDPLKTLESFADVRNPKVPLPGNIFGKRQNSAGQDFADYTFLSRFESLFEMALTEETQASSHQKNSLENSNTQKKNKLQETQIVSATLENPRSSPIDGSPLEEREESVEINADALFKRAFQAYKSWELLPVEKRAEILRKVANCFEDNRDAFLKLLTLEGGKTVQDGIAEIREAVDFCRYYADQGEEKFAAPKVLPGPTGEENLFQMRGRGVFLCISPWNFPLAIFTGQIAAALVAGNAVLAKPAGQTTMIAELAVHLMHKAGIPEDLLILVKASGREVGDTLVAHQKLSGVCFTGSTQTAWTINKTLAARKAPIIPLIAETGGQNVMVVDSTALPEQVIRDVLQSAFQSAGQRCSALRVLCVQEDVYPNILEMLEGAMNRLVVGDPRWVETDVGPVIDAPSKQKLLDHIEEIQGRGAKVLKQILPDPVLDQRGTYVAPTLIKIQKLSDLSQENFGPILHIYTFKGSELESLIEEINDYGYGLTFGIHSRIQGRVFELARKLNVGNVYANRNMIGAIVGSQPFGGMGLSGTGPKAGGENYLLRFVEEQSISIDTTARGGNASLMALV